ncbi:MAG: hypothetical protein NTY66_00065, partial [Candidatus Vogelbacteria bacterium]|nr:hypothetical protein [Candidatus Vogelbacteria bacterium]
MPENFVKVQISDRNHHELSLLILVKLGDTPVDQIANALCDISERYRLMGGPGLNFDLADFTPDKDTDLPVLDLSLSENLRLFLDTVIERIN